MSVTQHNPGRTNKNNTYSRFQLKLNVITHKQIGKIIKRSLYYLTANHDTPAVRAALKNQHFLWERQRVLLPIVIVAMGGKEPWMVPSSH